MTIWQEIKRDLRALGADIAASLRLERDIIRDALKYRKEGK